MDGGEGGDVCVCGGGGIVPLWYYDRTSRNAIL